MTDNRTQTIVERIKANDTAAFRELFLLYYPSVLQFIKSFVKDRSIAEDIAQEVFMKVWIYRKSLDASMPIRNYIFLVSRRQICSWFRKEVTLQQYVSDVSSEELENMVDGAMLEDDGEDVSELRRLADQIIAEMPEKRRLVFVMFRGEGLSAAEIAKRLGISPRTVNKHVQLAMKSLRLKLKAG